MEPSTSEPENSQELSNYPLIPQPKPTVCDELWISQGPQPCPQPLPSKEFSNSRESSTSSDTTENLSEQSITLKKYSSEWQQLSLGIDEVRRRALTGALRVSRLRSLYWAILLGVLPPASDQWIDVIRNNRKKYDILKSKYECNPRQPDYSADDPLSQNNESIWNQYFLNSELQSTITLDVVRTFPGVEVFKLGEIQTTMINVLFIFAKETPSLVYRQGMHEILAPLLFVLHSDHRAAEYVTLSEELSELMNPKFIEHDSYAMFEVIMHGIEKYYSIHEKMTVVLKQPVSRKKTCVDSKERVIEKESEVVRYLRQIKEEILSKYDLELAEHFETCDISLSLFGIRWLRVLFGREFSLQDLLVLWDALLAEGTDFSLTGYILVAMLIAIRMPLLTTDSMESLTILLNYPTTVDVQYVIEYALYLKHPDLYCKPATRSFNYFPIYKNRSSHSRKISTKKSATVSRVNRSNLDMSRIKIATSAEDSVIDGVLLQDTKNLREELSYANSVMSLCGLKLQQYETVLSKTLSKSLPASHPAHQALEGLKELRALLKTKYHSSADVEPALEADESGIIQSKNKQVSSMQSSQQGTSVTNTNENFVSKLPLAKDVQLKQIDIEKSESIDNLGMPCISPFGTSPD
ncbi:TBC1 domain family member 5 [Arctopsyche grandis]|uniref:TBC1 domain family member 5 n=1 Tax=Arctopsyche grandis TaxID=121162 RepID=UPI00406D8761